MRLFMRDYGDFNPTLCCVGDDSLGEGGGGGGGTEGAGLDSGGGSASAGDDAGGDTGGGGGDLAVAAGGGAEEVPAWNGELASLEEQEWYKNLPDDIKPHVRTGHETKLKTYDQGYQAKFRTLAEEKKVWEKKLAEQQESLRTERTNFERLLYGEEDPAATVKAELEGKLTELQTKYDALSKAQQEQAAAADKQAADAVHDYIKTQAADVYADDEAFETVVGLLTSGVQPEKALKMVRATLTAAEEPPRSVKAMGDDSGTGNSRSTTPKTWSEAVREERRILAAR